MIAVLMRSVEPINQIGVASLGNVLVLRQFGPIVELVFMLHVRALHLLQKYDVRIERLHLFAHVVNHQTAIEGAQTFVNIVGCNGDPFSHGSPASVS